MLHCCCIAIVVLRLLHFNYCNAIVALLHLQRASYIVALKNLKQWFAARSIVTDQDAKRSLVAVNNHGDPYVRRNKDCDVQCSISPRITMTLNTT